MSNFVTKAITRLVGFAYGLFTLILYGYLAIRRGTFFKKRTERQKLELQLGEFLLLELSLSFYFWQAIYIHIRSTIADHGGSIT